MSIYVNGKRIDGVDKESANKDLSNLSLIGNAKFSKASVSATGTATDEVKYITIDGVEKKFAAPQPDGTTIEYSATGKLQVKDGAISAAKLEKQAAADAGKAFIVKDDGTWELKLTKSVIEVSSLPATGEEETLYYLNAISGDNRYGLYMYNGSAWKLIANTANTATEMSAISIGGNASNVLGAVNIGYDSEASQYQAIAIGESAKATAEAAIQLGEGTNSTAKTLQVGNYQLLDFTSGETFSGKVLYDRLADKFTTMPNPVANLADGKVYQYIGDTTTTAPIYKHGAFYECKEILPSTTPKTYKWVTIIDMEAKENIVPYQTTAPTDPILTDMWMQKGETKYKHNGTELAPAEIEWYKSNGDVVQADATGAWLTSDPATKYPWTTLSGVIVISWLDTGKLQRCAFDDSTMIFGRINWPIVTADIRYDYKTTFTKEVTADELKYFNGTTWITAGGGGGGSVGTLNGVSLSGTNTSKTTKVIWEGTQAQYDALTSKDPITLYCITDGVSPSGSDYYTKTETDVLLSNKQATLVSGDNIKSINGTSLLGAGDMTIPTLPNQTGNANKFLVTNGTAASWSKIMGNLSDLTDDTDAYPIKKAKALEGVSATAESLNYCTGVTSNIQTQLDTKIPAADKGKANGVASLDTSSKIPLSQIPDALLGNLKYQGTWNASTGTPPAAAPDQGQYWTVSTEGEYQGVTYLVGDFIICDSADPVTWGKVDNTGKVVSVQGRTGIVKVIDDSKTSGTDYTYSIDKINYYYGTLQPELVSGTTIKTINNQNIMGAGNLSIGSETLQTMTAVSTNIIELSNDKAIYTYTVSGNITFTFKTDALGTLTGKAVTFELLLTMPTVYNVNFTGTIKWITPLDMTLPGTYLLVFKTFDGGSTWIGNLEGQW